MHHRRRHALVLLVVASVGLTLVAPIAAQQQTTAVHHGIDLAAMDRSVDPAEDFYRFANGGWLDRTEIPADRPTWRTWDELGAQALDVQLSLLEREATRGDLPTGSDQAKVIELFRQGTDIEARNANGFSPLDDELAAIDAIADPATLGSYLVEHALDGITGFFSIFVTGDLADSSINAAYLSGPPLGLPNRDYYLESDPANDAVRAAYLDATTRFLVLLGSDEATAARSAQAAYDLEAELAALTLTREQQQDFTNLYNPTQIADLGALFNGINWPSYAETLGISGTETIVVTELAYLKGLDEIIAKTPIETIKAMFRLQLMWAAAPYLDEATYDIWASLRERALYGTQASRPVEQRVLRQINQIMGEAVGQLYVAEVFPPEAKAQIAALVKNILAAYRARLETNPWLTPEARAVALDKLDRMGLKVGYPDRWRTYEDVEPGPSRNADPFHEAFAIGPGDAMYLPPDERIVIW